MLLTAFDTRAPFCSFIPFSLQQLTPHTHLCEATALEFFQQMRRILQSLPIVALPPFLCGIDSLPASLRPLPTPHAAPGCFSPAPHSFRTRRLNLIIHGPTHASPTRGDRQSRTCTLQGFSFERRGGLPCLLLTPLPSLPRPSQQTLPLAAAGRPTVRRRPPACTAVPLSPTNPRRTAPQIDCMAPCQSPRSFRPPLPSNFVTLFYCAPFEYARALCFSPRCSHNVTAAGANGWLGEVHGSGREARWRRQDSQLARCTDS